MRMGMGLVTMRIIARMSPTRSKSMPTVMASAVNVMPTTSVGSVCLAVAAGVRCSKPTQVDALRSTRLSETGSLLSLTVSTDYSTSSPDSVPPDRHDSQADRRSPPCLCAPHPPPMRRRPLKSNCANGIGCLAPRLTRRQRARARHPMNFLMGSRRCVRTTCSPTNRSTNR